MRKVAIVTDGSCDLSKQLVEKYNIHIVPFQVIIGSEAFKMFGDYGSINKDDFYTKIKSSTSQPRTAVPQPKDYVDAFNAALKEAESVIGIFLSGNLSSAFHIANIAASNFEDEDITLIDSKVAASALGALVVEAAKMAASDKTKKQIISRLRFLIPRTRFVGIMNNVETSYRSGRIGWSKKFLVHALNFKPIITFRKGYIVSEGTFRGDKDEIVRRMKFIAPLILRSALTDEIFIWHVRYEEVALELKEIMEKNNPKGKELIVQEAGPIIGTHVGENAIAFMYIGKYNKLWLKRRWYRRANLPNHFDS
ncbi:MAG: DegV family protein [Candidatus Heimdallarchaeota archaeon]